MHSLEVLFRKHVLRKEAPGKYCSFVQQLLGQPRKLEEEKEKGKKGEKRKKKGSW